MGEKEDLEWTEGLALEKPKKKRGLMFWVGSGCGCGCLGLVVLILVFGYFVKQAVDPERQWPKLREEIWFESRPNLELVFGWDRFGPEHYQLNSRTGFTGHFTVAADDEELQVMMSDETENPAMAANVERRTVEVQGREVQALFIRNVLDTSGIPKWFGEWAELPEGEHDLGRTLRLDLSIPGGRRLIFDLLTDPQGNEPTVEDVEEFLAPFDVWHQ